jgi:hypothetical protein
LSYSLRPEFFTARGFSRGSAVQEPGRCRLWPPKSSYFCGKNLLDKGNEIITVPRIDMKNTPLTTILLGVLAFSALLSVVFCWLYISNTRELRSLQSQANFINNNRTIINALANDTLEYSKTHRDIDPVLETLGFKRAGTNLTAAPKPASK